MGNDQTENYIYPTGILVSNRPQLPPTLTPENVDVFTGFDGAPTWHTPTGNVYTIGDIVAAKIRQMKAKGEI